MPVDDSCSGPPASSPRSCGPASFARASSSRRRSSASRRSIRRSTRSSRWTRERALAAADEIGRGDSRPFAGVPIAIKAQRAGRRLLHELRLALPRRPPARPQRLPRAPPEGGGLRGRRRHEPAGVRDPADHRAAPQRPDAQPVGPDAHAGRLVGRLGGRGRRPASCRSRTATTAAARCGSPPPAAASSGSSRAADGSRAAPTWATRTSPCDGVLTRTVAETAQVLDVLGGLRGGRRDVGAAARRALRHRASAATPAACGSR